MSAIKIRKIQGIFLLFAVAFFLFLVAAIVSRSTGRSSLWGSERDTSLSESLPLPKVSDNNQSEIHLQDFHRVEVKEGRKLWELRAKDAKYFASEGVTQVNEAAMIIYRPEQPAVNVSSRSAKLYLEGESLSRVELEGDIVVAIDNSIEMRSGLAFLDMTQRLLRAPAHATLAGPGYEVQGVELEVDIDQQNVRFYRDVESRFEQGAKVPGGVSSVFDR